MIVHLQHFDLAGRVIPDIQYLDEIDPVILLWDNHDIKEVKTHSLVFETGVGKGRLFVSTLNHCGRHRTRTGQGSRANSPNMSPTGPFPKRALKPETIGRMREKLKRRRSISPKKSGDSSPIRRMSDSPRIGTSPSSNSMIVGARFASASTGKHKVGPILTVGRGIDWM